MIVAPPCLTDILKGQFGKIGVGVVDHARNSGIDFYLGPKRHAEVRAARRVAAELRTTRLVALNRACASGAWNVGRCGLWPAYSYGYAITGMSVEERALQGDLFFGAPQAFRRGAPRPSRLHLQASTQLSKSMLGR